MTTNDFILLLLGLTATNRFGKLNEGRREMSTSKKSASDRPGAIRQGVEIRAFTSTKKRPVWLSDAAGTTDFKAVIRARSVIPGGYLIIGSKAKCPPEIVGYRPLARR